MRPRTAQSARKRAFFGATTVAFCQPVRLRLGRPCTGTGADGLSCVQSCGASALNVFREAA
jgi:hypothetical protein